MADVTSTLDKLYAYTAHIEGGQIVIRNIDHQSTIYAGAILDEFFQGIEGKITASEGGNALIGQMPTHSGSAAGGATLIGKLPKAKLTVASVTEFLGTLDNAYSVEITGLGKVDNHSYLIANAPKFSIAAQAGWVVDQLTGPMPNIVGAGQVEFSGVLDRNAPRAQLITVATLDVRAALDASLPPLLILQPVTVDGQLPTYVLTGEASIERVATYVTYAVNLANKSLTKFDHWSFTKVVRWQGKYYGVNGSGIFEITGVKADGADVSWAAEIPDIDFGSRYQKRLTDLYATARSPQDFDITVTSDEGSGILYTLTGSAATDISRRRAKLARGVRGTYWTLRLSGTTTPAPDLDDLELRAQVLSRRLK